MIFVKIDSESKLQTNDKTRMKVSLLTMPDTSAATAVYIQAEASGATYDITSDLFFDYIYSSSGTKIVTATAYVDESTEYTGEVSIEVVTPAEDNLFSIDADILAYEPEILNYVREGRSSWLDKHRAIQAFILDELLAKGYLKNDDTPYASSDVFSTDFKKWSAFLVLSAIYEELSNAIGDIFEQKSIRYKDKALQASNRCFLYLDKNGDGTIDKNEKENILSTTLVRR
jgi:hypothetical protein